MADYAIQSVLNMTNGLQASAIVSAKGRLFTFGGSNGSNILGDIQEYNPTENTIKTVATLPTPVWFASAAAVGDEIYVFGGENASSTSLQTIYVFDIKTYTVNRLSATLPNTNRQATAVSAGTDIYIFGGIEGQSTYSNKILKFNTVTKTMSTLSTYLNSRCSGGGSVLIGDEIYILGGRMSSTNFNENIQVFNVTTQTIRVLEQNIALPTHLAACAAIGTTIFLFGGNTSNSQTKVIQYFDTKTQTVGIIPQTMPEAVYRVGASAVDNNIYVVGGRTSSGVLKTINMFSILATPTTITYNGTELASLEEGQTANFDCNGKKAVGNVSILFGSKGSITYKGKTTEIEAGKTANLLCAGKKFATDVVVAVEKATSLIDFTINGTAYQAVEGMTWAEWVASSYNTVGAIENLASGVVCVSIGAASISNYVRAVCDINSNVVPRTNTIIADYAYTLVDKMQSGGAV